MAWAPGTRGVDLMAIGATGMTGTLLTWGTAVELVRVSVGV